MGDSDDEVSKQDQDRTNTTSSAPNTKRIICLVQADFNKMDQGNKRGPMSRLVSAKSSKSKPISPVSKYPS